MVAPLCCIYLALSCFQWRIFALLKLGTPHTNRLLSFTVPKSFFHCRIMGEGNTSTLSGYDIGGLVIIVAGLIFYRIQAEGDDSEDNKSEDLQPADDGYKTLNNETPKEEN